MLDLQYVREHPEEVKLNIINRGMDPKMVDIDQVLELDKQHRVMLREVERLRAERNRISGDIGHDKSGAVGLLVQASELKGRLRELEGGLVILEQRLEGLLLDSPNMSAKDVPVGKDEAENVVVKKWGTPPEFTFEPRDHVEIGEILGLIDIKRASKVSGTRFGYLTGEMVVLEFALFNLALKFLVKEGFVPVLPPVMIKKEIEANLGYGEHGGWEDMYILDKDDIVLVATSEHSLVAMHSEEVLGKEELPRRYVAFSTCFRREAGSYGRDTRGILRTHQFNKVEMVSLAAPEQSESEQEFLVSLEEKLMQKLELPYQLTQMCTGDLGQPAAKKFDIETWMPGQGKYRETHSCSNCTDFQARRLNIRFKDGGQTRFVHTLNGTVFSERSLIAILENYQQADGSVKVPEALVEYTGFSEIRR